MEVKLLKSILLLVVIFFMVCRRNDTFVVIGDERFTLSDFNDFYQFTPADDSLRRAKIIEDFINQKMAIIEARATGYAEDSVVMASMEASKRDVIIREYYKKKVLDKIKIKESEIRKVYEQFVNQYHLAEIVVENDSVAKHIMKELKKGIPFESLLVYSLDTITPGGDIGFNSEFQMPSEVARILKRTKVGKVAGPIKLGNYIYFFKLLERRRLTSPKYEEVKENLKSNMIRQKATEFGQKYIENLLKQARVEYNQEGINLLSKPESTLTEKELNTWVVRKYDTNFVRVKTVIRSVQAHLKKAPHLDPKFLIERELIPELVFERARQEKAENYPEIRRALNKTLDILIYQKYYSDNITEKVRVDSHQVVDYYNKHKADYPDKKLGDVYTIIYAKLRDEAIAKLRDSLFSTLRKKYQPVLNQEKYAKLLKGEK
ncbi:MAG: peptidyl-prolyl cis-trans isomerase [candidate division WOR-3 bacterium]|nr:peptidyl-prolyl cis-trans isomerase [candidate division WOR-3 bacterium]